MTEEIWLPSVGEKQVSLFVQTNRLMFNVEAQKEIENDPQVKIGLEYNFLEKLWLRTGINTGIQQMLPLAYPLPQRNLRLTTH